ncbi:hypothetical protein NDU88_005917 [Pleurodeles waltl]|uniref:Uncharacterized protein n=1 Tax=Pleurodeles waltl TaxID=8319 RepID=A0AAV7MBE0_PLEWA|nr:hypothetical protein NDU88_005917 [Pleurodeles waltl]
MTIGDGSQVCGGATGSGCCMLRAAVGAGSSCGACGGLCGIGAGGGHCGGGAGGGLTDCGAGGGLTDCGAGSGVSSGGAGGGLTGCGAGGGVSSGGAGGGLTDCSAGGSISSGGGGLTDCGAGGGLTDCGAGGGLTDCGAGGGLTDCGAGSSVRSSGAGGGLTDCSAAAVSVAVVLVAGSLTAVLVKGTVSAVLVKGSVSGVLAAVQVAVPVAVLSAVQVGVDVDLPFIFRPFPTLDGGAAVLALSTFVLPEPLVAGVFAFSLRDVGNFFCFGGGGMSLTSLLGTLAALLLGALQNPTIAGTTVPGDVVAEVLGWDLERRALWEGRGAPIQLRIRQRQDPEHQRGHGATGTPPKLGGHLQLGLRRLLAPVANVLPSFPAVGAPSVVDPQGPDVLGDGTPNILLLVGADVEE